MSISIQGIKIPNFTATKDKESGLLKVTGDYELVSSTDVVLARQTFNGYNSVKLEPSPASSKLMMDLMVSLTNDLNQVLGLA